MRTARKTILMSFTLVLIVAIHSGVAISAGFPEKPIEFTVPFAAGGGSDIMARTMAAMMEQEKILPQPLEAVLVSAFKRLSDSKIWQEKYLMENNLTPYYMAPEEFRRYLDDDTQKTRQTLSEMGLIK